jgi:hypothetical protein
MDPMIAYRSQTFINFRSFDLGDRGAHGYRWVDFKCFWLSTALNSEESV